MKDELLRVFASGRTAEEQLSALTELIKNRVLSRVAREPGFEAGVRRLTEIAAGSTLDKERLIATAALARVAKVSKALKGRVGELLSQSLVDPLPPVRMLDDAGDRFYVVSVWRLGRSEWWSTYLADVAAEEETAERVRIECVKGLVALSTDLASVLEELHRSLSRLRFATDSPGDSMARRLRRVVVALRVSFEKARTEPGNEAGDKLARLLGSAFSSTGTPTDGRAVKQLAEEAVGLVHDIVRARFSLATCPNTYDAIDVVRSWFGSSDWEGYSEGSQACISVARDIIEALNLLVRAGVTDDELVQKLRIALGSQERAGQVCRELADQVSGIPDYIRDWLYGRGPRTRSLLATESQERSMDEIIADLWVEATRLAELAKEVRQDTIPEIAVVAPRTADAVERLVGRLESMMSSLHLLARRRSLRIRGNSGEELEFSPLEHEMIGGPRPGIRRVRIVRPIVESIQQDGSVRVVRKGLVEPVERSSTESESPSRTGGAAWTG